MSKTAYCFAAKATIITYQGIRYLTDI
ncbi:uncharacterized protein FFNC_15567 [Fusarium fujikuroi]|nr:uncharacterized protein FFNC_15567 [Fusarium fujikuroi]